MKQSERSFQFKENYFALRESGKSVREIATMYDISRTYVYSLLRDLATELGIPYNSLLDQPHNTYEMVSRRKPIQAVKPVDYSSFRTESRTTISSIDKTIYELKKIIEDWPEMPEEL